MEEILRKSIRNGIILGGIAFVLTLVFLLFFAFNVKTKSLFDVGIFWGFMVLVGSIIRAVQYFIGGFALSLAFYYIKNKVKKKRVR